MPEPFEFHLYLAFLRRRWRLVAATVGAAVAFTLVVSLVQTPRYTAKVTLLIEAPGSSDPRAAMAVSPIYLESLRTYEHFALSDHLFAEAARKFQLQSGNWRTRPLEDLKRTVLEVSIPRNTKVLEIAVTLHDAAKAHALAMHLADRTVELSRQAGGSTDRDLAAGAQRELQQANERLARSEETLTKALGRSPTEQALQAELEKLEERRNEVERLALLSSISSAEEEERSKSGENEGEGGIRASFRASKKQAVQLRAEADRIAREIAQKQKQLADRKAEVEIGNSAYKAALDARATTEQRLRDVRGMAGSRSERISLLDPGFVPERPSSPKILLNLFIAAALGLALVLVYLTIDFNLQTNRADGTRRLARIVAKP